MVKRAVLFALLFVGVSSTAWAQTNTRIQVSVLFGYTLSDGVSGDQRLALDGNIYDRVDPTDGGNLGFSVGFMVNPQTEIGFMYRRQFSQAEISGPTVTKVVGDLNLDSYHGYFAYYFGDPDARVNPYFLGGVGATTSSDVAYTTAGGGTGTANGRTLFSSTWGAGLRVNAAEHFAIRFGVAWTPTYIKSDAAGWWCDPYWGCYVVGNAQYANQFHFEGGFTIRY
jgi:hypothetical protein